MLSRIAIRGLGPHEDTVLDLQARGHTEIEGRSQAGKSFLTEALTLALWGIRAQSGRRFATSMIREGVDEARIELWLGSGTILSRTVNRARTHIRERRKSGDTRRCPNADSWAAELGPLADPTIRLIVVPLAWRTEAAGANNGQPLRDALDRLLPSRPIREIVAQLMAPDHALKADALDEKGAVAQRHKAGQHLADRTGSLRQAQTHLSEIEADTPEAPSEDDVKKATETIKAHRAAEAFAADFRAHTAHEEAVKAFRGWQERRAKIGDRPDDSEANVEANTQLGLLDEAIEGMQARHAEISAALAALGSWATAPEHLRSKGEHRQLEEQLEAAKEALAAAEAHAGDCPTCGQPWPDAAANREALSRRVDVARARAKTSGDALAEAIERFRAHDAAERKQLSDGQAEITSEIYRAKIRRTELTANLRDQELTPAERWDQAMAQLGAEPLKPGAAPAHPGPRREPVTPEQLKAAQATLTAAERAEGAASHHRGLVARAAEAHDQARKLLDEAEAEKARCDALVAAVRAAPTVAVREQLASLGDTGPVTLSLLDAGGVEVLVDGLPYDQASEGRLIVADAWLRAGLRRAARLPWVPLILDSVQSVGGQSLPTLAAPTITLRTTDGDLRVVESAARGAV